MIGMAENFFVPISQNGDDHSFTEQHTFPTPLRVSQCHLFKKFEKDPAYLLIKKQHTL